MARKLDGLMERKALLMARCDAVRVELIMEAQDLHRRTRWIDTTYQVVQAVAPKLKFLTPLAGLLLARNFSGGSRALGVAQTLWQTGRQVLPFIRGLRAGQGLG